MSGTVAMPFRIEAGAEDRADPHAPVTAQDIDRVAALLRLLSTPEESATLEDILARAISHVEGA